MISSNAQIHIMEVALLVFAAVFCLPFQSWPLITACVVSAFFPILAILWRMQYPRNAKDYLFCMTSLSVTMMLQRLWPYADSIFYLMAMLISATVSYRVLLAVTASAFTLECLRQYAYALEIPADVGFRYLLFLVAGSLTYVLLREEKRQKEDFKRELDHLKYGIHQVESLGSAGVSEEDQTSRAVDAALALDDSLKNVLSLIHRIFKPDVSILWQFIPEHRQLRLRNSIGDTDEIRKDLILDLGEGPIGWAALNKKPFNQQGREQGVTYFASRKKPLIRSLLAIPVMDKDRMEGVLSIESEHLNYFPPDAEQALGSFAAQISEMIQLARVAKEREERAFEFQAFYHASKELSAMIEADEIIHKLQFLCAEIVSFDFCAVALVQDGQEMYSLYEWESGQQSPQVLADLPNNSHTWISWYLNNREEPVILSETQIRLQEMPLLSEKEILEDWQTFLAVPMRHQQKCIGALLLGSLHKEAFSSHQARIITILCNQAAVSLENSSILDKMEELAITDGLTGLYNHRFFQESFLKEIERAERQKQCLSLLIMDIDHFKGFNDNFGHPAGDFVLKNLAQLLRNSGRKVDLLARYGGEEFAALLPGIDFKNARKTAERWRKAVQRASFKWEGKSFAVTISAGFACYPADGEKKIELIEKADRALYEAKEHGRNQVRHISDS